MSYLLHSVECSVNRLYDHVQVGIGLFMMPSVIAAFTWIVQHTGLMGLLGMCSTVWHALYTDCAVLCRWA